MAFDQLVRTHGPRLLAVARRLVRNEEDARDCVQEAFLSAHRSIERFEGRSRISTWLHRIVTNAALMKLRSRQHQVELPIDPLLPTFDLEGFREGPRRANSLTPEELLQRADRDSPGL
jgi:RNA polymerase sigma-70 factor (ECF subfamily)